MKLPSNVEIAQLFVERLWSAELVQLNSPASWARDRMETLVEQVSLLPLAPRYYVSWKEEKEHTVFCLGVRRASGILDRYPGGYLKVSELGLNFGSLVRQMVEGPTSVSTDDIDEFEEASPP